MLDLKQLQFTYTAVMYASDEKRTSQQMTLYHQVTDIEGITQWRDSHSQNLASCQLGLGLSRKLLSSYFTFNSIRSR